MRKEYRPAILMYIVSALFYVAAIIGAVSHSSQWATWMCLGALWMLLASSKMTQIGKKLREDEEKEENDEANIEE